MEVFLTRGWDLILPASCGGASTLARGAIPPARWLHQLIIDRLIGSGFLHRAGRCDGVRSFPPAVEPR